MSLIPPQHLGAPAQRMRVAQLRLASAHYRYNLVLAALVAEEERHDEMFRRRRRWWVRPWLSRRPLYGQYETIMAELWREHHGDFRAFLRMEPQMFHELLQRVGSRIEKSTDVNKIALYHSMKVEVLSDIVGLKPLKRRHSSSDTGEEAMQHENKGAQPVIAQSITLQKRLRNASVMTVTTMEIAAFFRLFDDDLIQDFLWMDSCNRVADKYLLAMVFAYFKRANFTGKQINRMNFFLALYLANDMEEDEEDPKYDIFPWALGTEWKDNYPNFLRQRDRLLRAIDYRAAVSSKCCEEIMGLAPNHAIWQRERKPHHGGAERKYPCEDDTYYPKGPDCSPVHCRACTKSYKNSYLKETSPECAESPDSGFLYLSSCSDSSTDSAGEDMDIAESFNMKGLRSTLQQELPFDDSNIWAV